MTTILELKQYLAGASLSPEELAREVKISNMTIRRLLQRPDTDPIPEKYRLQLSQHANARRGGELPPEWTNGLRALLDGNSDQDFGQLLSQLEKSGKEAGDYRELKTKTRRKLLDPNLGKLVKNQVKTVLGGVFSERLPLRYKMICAGAILYFLNPLDLIPDALPGVGYLDDFAIMSLVVGILAGLPGWASKKEGTKSGTESSKES